MLFFSFGLKIWLSLYLQTKIPPLGLCQHIMERFGSVDGVSWRGDGADCFEPCENKPAGGPLE